MMAERRKAAWTSWALGGSGGAMADRHAPMHQLEGCSQRSRMAADQLLLFGGSGGAMVVRGSAALAAGDVKLSAGGGAAGAPLQRD